MSPFGSYFIGDNYDWQRKFYANHGACIKLSYNDPPFNAGRDFNNTHATGNPMRSQQEAFKDTWRWTENARADFDNFIKEFPNSNAARFLRSQRVALGEKRGEKGTYDGSMLAYLTHLIPRAHMWHLLLVDDGWLALHCDSTAQDYIKAGLDAIFGRENYRNSIKWRRCYGKGTTTRLSRNYDTILTYAKSRMSEYFQPKGIRIPLTGKEMQDERGLYVCGRSLIGDGICRSQEPWGPYDPKEKGRHWAAKNREASAILIREGVITAEALALMTISETLDLLYDNNLLMLTDQHVYCKKYVTERHKHLDELWEDIPAPSKSERVGYKTEKPVKLLRRIIGMTTKKPV